ncbi:uncharacterized protein FTOL_08824 [Fusarium torulosum]|uniref:Bulb-type lectin domain-containing protein n=1 Tax=Fusarium torulosum TaxID=33205 RepID=A0AAE8MDY0_9HYPO|nr:uncharacterized protein FTOL_08824 [Fusarium torulosum]
MPGDRLNNGEWLLVDNSLFSEDGSVELRMQKDGKLAVYHGERCVWQNTAEQDWNIHGVKMQEDGNLVIYDDSGKGKATWHTDTSAGKGNNSTTLVVQNDGNVVLYNTGGVPIWATASNK